MKQIKNGGIIMEELLVYAILLGEGLVTENEYNKRLDELFLSNPVKIVPTLNFGGNCREAIQMYEKAFNGNISCMITYGNSKPINKNNSARTVGRCFQLIYCPTSFFHDFIYSLHFFFCIIHNSEEIGIARLKFNIHMVTHNNSLIIQYKFRMGKRKFSMSRYIPGNGKHLTGLFPI